jgi:hypothetical protein
MRDGRLLIKQDTRGGHQAVATAGQADPQLQRLKG